MSPQFLSPKEHISNDVFHHIVISGKPRRNFWIERLLVKQFVPNKYRLTLFTLVGAYYKNIQGQKREAWNTFRDENIQECEKSNMVPVATKLIVPLVAGFC